MAYGRVRLAGAFAIVVAAPLHRAAAQAELPAALRGTHNIENSATPRARHPSAIDARPTEPAPASLRGEGDLPRPFASLSASAGSLRDSLVALARAQIGRRYRFGGTSPEHGFDCSGLVRYVMAALHVDLPRTAKEQARSGSLIPRDTSQLQPGDLVTFGSPHRIVHIGIYVGGGRFVQASSKAGRVIETPLYRRLLPGVKPWRGARRVMPAADSTSVSIPTPPEITTTRDDDG